MKRINVMVSDKAKAIILNYQEDNNFSTLDDTVDSYIIQMKETVD